MKTKNELIEENNSLNAEIEFVEGVFGMTTILVVGFIMGKIF